MPKKSTKNPDIVSKRECANRLHIAQTLLDSLIEKELVPVLERGGQGVQWKLDFPAVKKAYDIWTKDMDLSSAKDPKTRKMVADARLKELAVLEMENQLVPIDAASKQVATAIGSLRGELLAIPSRLTSLSTNQVVEVKSEIIRALDEVRKRAEANGF